jgi:hypothetical protein
LLQVIQRQRKTLGWLLQNIFSRNYVLFRSWDWAIPRQTEFRKEKNFFFRGITKTVPSLFCRILMATLGRTTVFSGGRWVIFIY